MKKGCQQQKTYRFKVEFTNRDGHTETKRFFSYDAQYEYFGIPRASFFKLQKGLDVPSYRHVKVEKIREPAYKMVRIQLD